MLVVTAAGESPLCQISCLHQLYECVVLIATVLHVPAAVVAVATPVCVIGTVVSPCPAQALPSVRRREWRGAAASDAPTTQSNLCVSAEETRLAQALNSALGAHGAAISQAYTGGGRAVVVLCRCVMASACGSHPRWVVE